ncbi:MAG: DUF3806 domain-containing protein [Planctomycetota bacterium]
MAPDGQSITAPTADELARLAEQRAAIEGLVAQDEENLAKLRTAAGKLGTIRAILDAGVFRPEQTYELQCLGVLLGDAFVLELGMEWVTVEDEHGRDPAVRVPGTSTLLFPLTMISKRVERGEAVDVFDLFNGIAARVDGL